LEVLFPMTIDDVVFTTKEAWAVKPRANRNIGDFRAWKLEGPRRLPEGT